MINMIAQVLDEATANVDPKTDALIQVDLEADLPFSNNVFSFCCRRKYGRSSTIAQFSPLLIGFTRYQLVFVCHPSNHTLSGIALESKKLSFQ